MHLVQLGYKICVYRHAEMWLAVDSTVPDEKFQPYVRREGGCQAPNAQQQVTEAWEALEAQGYRVIAADGAKIDFVEETTALMVALKHAQRELRARRRESGRTRRETVVKPTESMRTDRPIFDSLPPSVSIKVRGGASELTMEWSPVTHEDWPKAIADLVLQRGGPELSESFQREMRDRISHYGQFRFTHPDSGLEVEAKLDDEYPI